MEGNPLDPFEPFIFTWIALNGWGSCVLGEDGDRKWVEAVAFDQWLGAEFASLLQTDDAFRGQAEQFASFWPIFKASQIRREVTGGLRFEDHQADRRDVVSAYLQQGFSFEPECWRDHGDAIPLDWPHTLVTLYPVRNNLFHGEKSRHSEMDTRIVEASFQVLYQFIDKAQLFC